MPFRPGPFEKSLYSSHEFRITDQNCISRDVRRPIWRLCNFCFDANQNLLKVLASNLQTNKLTNSCSRSVDRLPSFRISLVEKLWYSSNSSKEGAITKRLICKVKSVNLCLVKCIQKFIFKLLVNCKTHSHLRSEQQLLRNCLDWS